ncbi:hypothetical protein [Costertonia aggregata]|uniref:Uncharacterized protein n=1 Tax=Costertonia aggregata TaxID=343403 RepID=A0A7H9ASV3_9FLAO|nr:hypothetical protein [Costertonia aggregata]QLG46558.1 hypothetical protein HYG79_14780 [Costertonia aggregata]
MEKPTYFFTVINKDTKEIICKNETDLELLKVHLPEAMFQYIYKKAISKRLGARKLIQFDRICLIGHGKACEIPSDELE